MTRQIDRAHACRIESTNDLHALLDAKESWISYLQRQTGGREETHQQDLVLNLDKHHEPIVHLRRGWKRIFLLQTHVVPRNSI